MVLGEFQRSEKSPNCDGTPQEWLVFRLLVINCTLGFRSQLRPVGQQPMRPAFLRQFFSNRRSGPFRLQKKSAGGKACVRQDFWNELASRNHLTACYEVLAGPESPEWRAPEGPRTRLCANLDGKLWVTP